jgi:hypothetical protein
MAQKITVTLEDDLDGGPAAETVRFTFGATDYEIDLNKKNARAFRSSWHRSLNMHVRLAGVSAVNRSVLSQAVNAAATSGPGRKARASRSATVGASLPVLRSSTRQRPPDADGTPPVQLNRTR